MTTNKTKSDRNEHIRNFRHRTDIRLHTLLCSHDNHRHDSKTEVRCFHRRNHQHRWLLTAKQKSDAVTEETINADGFSDTDADDDVVPRNVIENAETGGFSFSSPEPVIAEPVDIAEANDEEPLSTTTVDEDDTIIEEAKDEDTNEGTDDPDEVSDASEEAEQPMDEKPSEDSTSEEETSEPEGEEEPVPGIEYYEEKPEDDTDKQDFDVNDAFDPDLLTPKYGVTELVEPPVSDEAQEKANMVNASLLPIASKGNQVDSFDLSRIIREQRAGQLNIETHDEVTNY